MPNNPISPKERLRAIFRIHTQHNQLLLDTYADAVDKFEQDTRNKAVLSCLDALNLLEIVQAASAERKRSRDGISEMVREQVPKPRI